MFLRVNWDNISCKLQVALFGYMLQVARRHIFLTTRNLQPTTDYLQQQ
jgi:hypothetical protein